MHKIQNQISKDQHALTQFIPIEVPQSISPLDESLRSTLSERNNYSKRFEKYAKLQKVMAKEKPHTKKRSLKKINSLDHFFEYYAIQEPIEEIEEKPSTESQEDRIDSNTISPHPGDISPLRHPKSNSKNGSFFNNFGTNKTKQNLTPNFQITNEKNEESTSKSLKQIDLSKCGKINSCKNGSTEQNNKIIKKPSPIQVISTIKETRNVNRADVIAIGGYKYRRKYNTEYKMQLRRKSCCCSHCGRCTNYENKHQNIVNDILIRRNRHFTKIIKVVNFLNKMNRTFKQIPDEDSKSPVKHPANHPEEEQPVTSLSLIEHHETKAVIEETKAKFSKIAGAFEQAAFTDVQNKEKQNKRKGQRKSMTICVRNGTLNKQSNDQTTVKQQHLEMKQIEEDNGFSGEQSIDIEQHNRIGISKRTIEIKRKPSINFSILSEDECNLRTNAFQRSKIKQRSLSQFQQKGQEPDKDQAAKERHNQFLMFVQNKIKEAKKKRQLKEAKFVGKTPLNVLCRLLSQGKRDSVFDNTQSQKRIQMLIESKSIHSNTSRAQKITQNQFVIRSNTSSRNKHRNSSQNNRNDELNQQQIYDHSGNNSASYIQLKLTEECYEQFNQNEQQMSVQQQQPLSFFHKKHQETNPLKEREQNFILTHSQRTVTSPMFISKKTLGLKQISSPSKSLSQQNDIEQSNGSDSTKNLLRNDRVDRINSSQENRRNSSTRKGQLQQQIPPMSLELRHCRTSKELFRKKKDFPSSMSRRTPEKWQQQNQTQNPWYSAKGQDISSKRIITSSKRIITSANIIDQPSFISSARVHMRNNIQESNKSQYTSQFVVVPSQQTSNPSRPRTNPNNNLLNKSAINANNTFRKIVGLYKQPTQQQSPKIKFPLDNATTISSPKFTPYLHQLFSAQKETNKHSLSRNLNSSQSQRIKSPQTLRFQSGEGFFLPNGKNTKHEEES